MLNIVKNILAWADKEPITPHEAIGVFNGNVVDKKDPSAHIPYTRGDK
jgi:hypothetical protein